MQIALYKGKSWESKAIRFITRSDYSHAAFVFDKQASEVAATMESIHRIEHYNEGAVVEAWTKGGVRNVTSLSDRHTPGTEVDIFNLVKPLTVREEQFLLREIAFHIGDKYDWKGVLSFVTRKPGKKDDVWFCSELVDYCLTQIGRTLFARTEPWEVAPGLIPRSLALQYDYSFVTKQDQEGYRVTRRRICNRLLRLSTPIPSLQGVVIGLLFRHKAAIRGF